ncbi:hypothetical protein SASPL_101992 [Salvia splendens]|uniref:Nucleotide-diphospho-sugar transferase domain-containing protein n=1 Tax=Salvia splendens TaxID=180675 RepID=A0A8X9AD04_SALSN|nr:uncharacterized protein At4g15970-like [Salvia splendens]KAG6437083.1 hypothetical protein SASPL_101992 [Salvia splendens]
MQAAVISSFPFPSYFASSKRLKMTTASPDFSPHTRRPGVSTLLLLLVAVVLLSCFLLHTAVQFGITTNNGSPLYSDSKENSLERVLKVASMPDNTVILTTLNEAWAAPDSVIDLFLESFRMGDQTRWLLNHLLIVSLDQKAFSRCMAVHSHCFSLVTEGVDFSHEAYFMTPDYLKMMWRRIDFLRSVLEMGYNFVFTDADIMWFRDPFPHFHPDADFQIACDHFSGRSDDLENKPNGGFKFVRSNKRSIEFYKFWHASRGLYPGLHDQDVLNKIKNDSFILEMGLHLRFLDTSYFGGFCEPSEDLDEVCTMHANCCLGLSSKLHDLRILLEDWKMYVSSSPMGSESYGWRVPLNCSLDSLHLYVQQPDPTWPNSI